MSTVSILSDAEKGERYTKGKQDEIYEDDDGYFVELKQSGSSVPASLFNMLNTIMGGGMLALPAAYGNSGLAVGIILTIIVMLLSALSSNFLVLCSQTVGNAKSYKDLAFITFGVPGALIIDLCLVLFMFGTCAGYIVIIGDLLTPYFAEIFNLDDPISCGTDDFAGIDSDSTGDCGEVAEYWAYIVSAIMCVAVLLPLCMLKKIDFLKYSSTAALVCITYLIVVIAFTSISAWGDELDDSEVIWGNLGINSFAAVPVITFAFSFHAALFPIQAEMENPNNINIVVLLACLIAGAVYSTVGILGYLTFRDEVDSNILVNFDETIPVKIGKIALVIVLCFSYPLTNFPMRLSLWNIFFPSQNERSCWDWWPQPVRQWKGRTGVEYQSIDKSERNSGKYVDFEDDSVAEEVNIPHGKNFYIITVVMMVLCYCASVAIPDIEAIFGLVGATAGSVLIFMFPGACVLKLTEGPLLSPRKVGAIALIVIGIVAAVLGCFVTILEW